MKSCLTEKNTTLAILPFETPQQKEESAYFSRGLVEELVVDLAHFHDLHVISSYSADKLTAGDDEIEAANKIGISFILKGTIWYRKEAIRVSTQLVATENRKVLWGEHFESEKEDLFDLQDKIVERVTYAISSQVEHTLLQAARKKLVTNLESYDCWLRGMDLLRKGTLEADNEARGFFQQALEIDPQYSRAYAGLSLSHFNEWSCQLWELYEHSEQKAFNYAVQAYQLDDSDHIVQMILGRIYLYRRQFAEAEVHIEKSLSLNKNDADNLVQLASCLAFLGRAAEGERLFKRALLLNPYRNLWYYQYGSFVLFVQGKYERSIELALRRQLTNIWVDLPGYISAANAYLGKKDEAKIFLEMFLDSYIQNINRGKIPSANEVMSWVKKANPFRYEEDFSRILDGLALAGIKGTLQGGSFKNTAQADMVYSYPSIFCLEHNIWHLAYNGNDITMVDLKGLHDIRRLLETPETDVHCSELMGTTITFGEDDRRIDEKARLQYKKHLQELEVEISQAEDNNDLARSQMLKKELDELIMHLSRDLGTGGKSRKLDSQADKSRAAVTLRIRSAIKKVEKYHPQLAKHLSTTIQTGIYCRYSPEKPIDWKLA